MSRKNVTFWDEKILHPQNGRIYYLRYKKTRLGELTITVRTHRNGKGIAKTKPVTGIILSEKTKLELLHAVYKKFKFQFVTLIDLPPL